jgi:hypothetical protein
MTFTVQTMLGDQALVSGSDIHGNEGKTIVSTRQWDELKAKSNFSAAAADFDAAVEAFFAPLVEASDKVKNAVAGKPRDPAEYVVLTAEVEGVDAKPADIVALSQDSIILRLIEEGNTDRLVWVTDSRLGVLSV